MVETRDLSEMPKDSRNWGFASQMAVDVSHTKFEASDAKSASKRVNAYTHSSRWNARRTGASRSTPPCRLSRTPRSRRARRPPPRAPPASGAARAATLASKRHRAALRRPRRERRAAHRAARPAASRGALVAPAAARFPFPRVASSAKVSAETTVRGMYDAINRRDVEAALAFVDDDILYEDLPSFLEPFGQSRGAQAVRGVLRRHPGRYAVHRGRVHGRGRDRRGHDVVRRAGGRAFPERARRVVLPRRPGFRETRVRARRRRAPREARGRLVLHHTSRRAAGQEAAAGAEREEGIKRVGVGFRKRHRLRASTKAVDSRATRSPPPVCTPWARRTGSSCCCPLRGGRVCPASPRGRWRPRRSRRWWPSPPTSSSCCLCSSAGIDLLGAAPAVHP